MVEMKVPERMERFPHRVYVMMAVIDKFGGTKGCNGCLSAISRGGTGVIHSEECRKRMETEMKKDPEEARRLQDTYEKRR